MLRSLSIKNFTLIDSIDLEFDKGLNIIIGETGAGKSIIVDALLLALGDRASSDLVRNSESKAIIEAIFEIEPSHPSMSFLRNNDIDSENTEIITRRELSAKGTSRCFINDTPVQLYIMKEFGDLLVDFHGQHDHQLLLKPEHHLSMLDNLCNFKTYKQDFNNEFEHQSNLIKELNELINISKSSSNQIELFKFELDEITKINPQPDEVETLEHELKILENAETIYSLSKDFNELMSDSDISILSALSKIKKNLEQLNIIDNSFSQYLDEFISAEISLNEIGKFVSNYSNNISFDSERVESIRERLSILKGLRKKYTSYENIFERIEFLERQLLLISNYDEEIKHISEEISKSRIKLGNIALKISEIRRHTSKSFEKKITDELVELSLENAVFNVRFNVSVTIDYSSGIICKIKDEYYKCHNEGIDNVEFYISTNPGEPPRPLAEIASGGEISRIMLAIKSVSASNSNTPILIFDEIDTGISGKVARRVGLAMKNLSENHQLIAITHLAQIASLADKTITVDKHFHNNSTVIEARVISGEERDIEIAKLISGENVTESSLQSVQELSRI